MLAEVQVGKDPTLQAPEWKAKRVEAWAMIKVARMQLTCEVKNWEKMVSKYESKVSKG